METLDFDWTAFQGFFELSKTERDLSSPNVILTNGIRVIRQLKIAFCGFLFRAMAGGGPRLSEEWKKRQKYLTALSELLPTMKIIH